MIKSKFKTLVSTALPNGVRDLIYQGASPIAQVLKMNDFHLVNDSGLGDFPWYWQASIGTLNGLSYSWVNSLFTYDATNQVLKSNGTNFTSSYFNLLGQIVYSLSTAEQQQVDAANLTNSAVINTLLNDWVQSQGPIAGGTQSAQLNAVMTTVLSWGAAGLTYATLSSSMNPLSLLPNRPIGTDQIISDLMNYANNSAGILNITSNALSMNNQVSCCRRNISPVPSTPGRGWTKAQDSNGNTSYVPEIDFSPSVAEILNSITATGSGTTINVKFSSTKTSSNEVTISASGQIGGTADIDFVQISGDVGATYNFWQLDTSLNSVDIELEFRGVTKVSVQPVSFSVSDCLGWWNPTAIQDAVAHQAGADGYSFSTQPTYNFGTDGNFGLLKSLMISQQPIMKLTFHTQKTKDVSQYLNQYSNWGVSLFGVPLFGGSQSYTRSTVDTDNTNDTVTVTMSPPDPSAPISILDHMAYVIGAEVDWVGSSS